MSESETTEKQPASYTCHRCGACEIVRIAEVEAQYAAWKKLHADCKWAGKLC